jgi:hypothetical protein
MNFRKEEDGRSRGTLGSGDSYFFFFLVSLRSLMKGCP